MPSAATKGLLPARRAPQRTCVACGAVIAKRDLVRVVRGADGVRPDPTGKLPGRGAYLHADRSCWEAGLKKKKLERSLKIRLTTQDIEALSSFGSSLPLIEAPA